MAMCTVRSPNKWLKWDRNGGDTFCTAAYAITKAAAKKFMAGFNKLEEFNCDVSVIWIWITF